MNMSRIKQVVEMNGKNGKLYREWIKFAHLGVGCPFSTDALLNPVVSSDTMLSRDKLANNQFSGNGISLTQA